MRITKLYTAGASALLALVLLGLAAPSAVAAPFGNALELDGTDDYANVADNTSLDIGDVDGEDFTVETFFFVSNATKAENENDVLFSKGTAPRGNVVFRSISMDTIVFRLTPTTTISANTDISDGWHHVAFVYDNEFTPTGDLFQIYYDGSLFASTSAIDFTPGFPNTSSAFDVGAFAGAGAWDDAMDEFRVSDVVRYTGSYAVPSSPFSTDANTRALWHFDEIACSTSFADSSGNGNTLTGQNGAQTGDPASGLCGTTTTLNVATTATDIEASGTVTPSHAGLKVVVTLFQKVSGSFVELDKNKPVLDGTSAYATSFTRPAGGKCKLKAVFKGDGDHSASSASERFDC